MSKLFKRDRDGSARVRLRFTADEATRIETAAGRMPVTDWLFQVVNEAADRQADETNQMLSERMRNLKENT